MSKKKFKDYDDKYGSIPKNIHDRFIYLINTLNVKPSDIDKLNSYIEKFRKIEFTTVSFVFYFVPQATQRPRYSRFTKAFYVKNALDYNEIFRKFVESCDDINYKISTPCKFYVKTYSPVPSSMTKIEKLLAELELIPNVSRPDWDNLGKTYSDMVQKHLIVDDSLIFDGRVQKFYSFKPRIEITIKFMNEYDSDFNRKRISKIVDKENKVL